MTDSMNFGPDWIRNLSSEGNSGGGTGGGSRYQLADFRYGREEMLALFDRNIKPPVCLSNFKSLFSESTLLPLALLPVTEDEQRGGGWQGRPLSLGGPPRGRGGSLERGGRINRGRGGSYQAYGRPNNFEGSWGNGESGGSDWSPRKEYAPRPTSMDNWRRSRNSEEEDVWRMSSSGRGMQEKWSRQTSWRGEGEEERTGPPERGGRPGNWHEQGGVNHNNRGPPVNRRSWDNEDHLPEWANENPLESGGSFDDRGAFHGSDDEQYDGRGGGGHRKEGLQKSTSQQHIPHKLQPPLLTSKSTISLVQNNENQITDPPNGSERVRERPAPSPERERKLSVPEVNDKSKEVNVNRDRAKSEGPPRNVEEKEQLAPLKPEKKVEENDFEKLQEDFVSKLVVDEEMPKATSQGGNNFDMPGLAPPPNLGVPGQDKWFYQDPQGQMQGPFTSMEMSEWCKAGYFGQDLKVRRQCDERFFLLGELMAICGNPNPFQSNARFPVLKNDVTKMQHENDLQFQYLPQQLSAYRQAQARVMADPWSALAVQQQELASQRLIMQQQQVQQDMSYMPQPPNPLMQMISQMQQANKLPTPGMMDNKQPPNMTAAPGGMDPHLHLQMTNFLSMQNRLPGGLPGQMPAGIPVGVTGALPPDALSSLPGAAALGAAGIPLPTSLSSGLGLNHPRPSSVERTAADTDPIASLLKQLQQQKQHNQVESLWQQNQFGPPNTAGPVPQQWPGQAQADVPMSMWDMQKSTEPPGAPQRVKSPGEPPMPKEEPKQAQEEEKLKKTEKQQQKENKQKEEEKELKRKKKAEEEQQKKEADERRKQEQRRQEAEKKAEAERRRKEEDRIKKELEKAKKEAEEKRLRELEEKRKQKEQRKLDEEAKKRTEEERRKIEEDRIQREKEQREREERQRAEERRLEQQALTKIAPWSQSNSTFGMSLAEIQKAEKERKAQEVALQAQRAQMERELQLQQQQQMEKAGGLQLGWAKKTMEPRKVKSLAEIQAEEQERLAKEAAESRLKKEKEARETAHLQHHQQANTIWSGQSLSWASAPGNQPQFSSSTSNITSFWDEPPVTQKPVVQPVNKPSAVSKSSSMSTINSSTSIPSKQAPQPANKQPQKAKSKKEEPASTTGTKKNHNNNVDDDFTNWCYKALGNMSTNVDIPTFIVFLRDIESAFEVREYCKEYLGESNTTAQFANNFLEKRRSFKPKNAHKDDMCSPAPAITPSMHAASADFQEVKGKNKKNKKSKMLKVDARILGFNVTSAPDRINVGDRDYGDNS
ncbi:GIGYF family protein Gyf-like isoform X2 [Anthonomus grandis grandis]|uniref:GIGYF family protein Gyf-like isoform X2 n=1 Tax=Anthonomus grandis grandis TaxID=2921223 RepID=UPI0021668E82|nr:GIGYF family protein Gyf-like isoform X2 [Anthonomus grandis grandis]